jgi:hypothetical protein
LRRYGNILEREEHSSARREDAPERLSFDALLNILERFGILASPAPGYWIAGSSGFTAVNSAAGGDGGGVHPVLAMDSPFSCVLYPGIALADVLALAAFLTIREAGVAVRFELTRESAVRGFDRGMDAAGMIALLERLSGNRIGENLIWSLKDWEKRYGEVNLRRGIVLTLSEDRRYLAETEPVAGLIREALAPGVYLLSGSETTAAEEALRKAGVDIISRRAAGAQGDRAPGGLRGGETHTAFAPLENPVPAGKAPSENPAAAARKGRGKRSAGGDAPAAGRPDALAAPGYDPAGREALKKRFHGALAKLSLSREERDELSARIDRRLILNESQLESASVRYEKLEARLLDYVGKAAVAKQAISSKSMVEVTWPHPQWGVSQIIGIPAALEKTGGESVLVLTPLPPNSEDEADKAGGLVSVSGEPIRIPLGKISLLRRIKKSIFGE